MDGGELSGDEITVTLSDLGNVGQCGQAVDDAAAGLEAGHVIIEGAAPLRGGLVKIGAVRHGQDGQAAGGGLGERGLPAVAEERSGECGTGGVLRKEPHVVNGGGEGENAVDGDARGGGLEADDAAKGGRPDH